MKNIVLNDEYHQKDFKPSELFGQYLQLLRQDLSAYFSLEDLNRTNCPACGQADGGKVFDRFGFVYEKCSSCATWWVNPRPNLEQVDQFYHKAPSRTFWRNQLSEATRLLRQEKIIKPRVEWVLDTTQEVNPRATHWVDVHTSQIRYAEALKNSTFFKQKTVIHPYYPEKLSADEGLTVLTEPFWAIEKPLQADVITLFEVMDHTSDVGALMSFLRQQLKPNGLCFMTTILSSGFDVNVLGVNAQNIFPPDRLNVFSVQGLKILMEKNGFECLELSTPGILDVEIVAQALKQNVRVQVSDFLRDLVLSPNEDLRLNFQEFLQANLLSSYGRMVMRKI